MLLSGLGITVWCGPIHEAWSLYVFSHLETNLNM